MSRNQKDLTRSFSGLSKMSPEMSELTEAEKALLDDPTDPLARVSDARAARLLAGVVIGRQAELQWTADLVKLRLQEAARGCERLVGRVGPKAASGFWPATLVEFSDLVGQAGARAVGARVSSGGLTEREVARIEQALQWPARYLVSDDLENERKTLQIWLWCEAKGQPFSRFFQSLTVHRRQAYRWLDRGAEVILAGLRRDKVLP